MGHFTNNKNTNIDCICNPILHTTWIETMHCLWKAIVENIILVKNTDFAYIPKFSCENLSQVHKHSIL